MLLCGAMAGSALASETDAAKTVSSIRGAALFEGRELLSGSIRGHTLPLPPAVSACNGCHARPSSRSPSEQDVPSLDAVNLLTQKSRRNGPPSAYSQGTFCRVVQTGVDPVHILVSRSMPVFAASPQQCDSLWLYLMERNKP